MENTTITYKITVQGIAEAEAQFKSLGAEIKNVTINQNGSITASGTLTREQADLATQTGNVAKATDRAAKSQQNYVAHIAKTTILSAGVNKLFLGMVDAAGQAVKQVDLFTNFPASMAALGLSSKDASDALLVLRNYAARTGISLTEATTSVTRFAEVTKNIKAATAEFVGVKNALIAGGAGAEVQSNALEQLIQSYSRGKPQLIEWRSLMVAMPAQLNQVAKAMKLPNAQALGEGLTKGKISMQDFVTQLTKLSTGTGPIAQQAIARMQGIEFATNVMKNALVNGLAAIYQTIGRQNIISFFTFLTQVIQVLSSWIVILVREFITLFNFLSGLVGGPQFGGLTKDAKDTSDALGSGASNASDMADGLGDAADNADAINKSLASFDKMNVLDKGKGKKDTGAGGTGPLSPADAAALGDIFNKLGGTVGKISDGAKIVAGILASLVGIKFAEAIINQVDGVAKSFSKATTGIKNFKTFLAGDGKDKANIFARAKSSASSFASTVGGLVGGVASNAKLLTNPWVLLALAIAAVVAGIIYLFNTNEDFKKGFLAAWDGFIKAVKNTGDFIKTSFGGVLKWLDKEFTGVGKPFHGAMEDIKKVVKEVGDFFGDLAKKIGITGKPMQVLGKAAGVLAVAVTVLVAAWGIYEIVMIAVTAVTTAFGIVMAIITSPITLVILAIAALVAIVFLLITHWQDVMKWAGEAWDFIVSIWQGVAKWFNDNVTQPIKNFFVGLWNDIKTAFSEAVTWFGNLFIAAWEAIKTAWNAVLAFFQSIWDGIKNIFSTVAGWFGDAFRFAWEAIKTAFSLYLTFFQNVWNGIIGVFSGVGSWFAGVFQDAWNKITSIFSGLWSWFRDNVWNKIVSIFSNIGSSIGDAISGAFKGVVNTALNFVSNFINNLIRAINGAIGVINKLPGVNISKVGEVSLPRLATGGVVQQATMAMIGENGAEAVVPLENNTEWIDTLASKLNERGSGTQPIQLVVQIGEDKVASKIIDLINEKTNMSGRNAIIV